MTTSGSVSSNRRIARLLRRHRTELADVRLEPILTHLVKKRVLSKEERESMLATSGGGGGDAGSAFSSVDKLIEILPQKGYNAFREFCVVLELDCPRLLTSLVLDSADSSVVEGAAAHSRDGSIVSNAMPPKFNNRELELMNRSGGGSSSTAGGLTASSGGGSSSKDIYNNAHIYNSVPSGYRNQQQQEVTPSGATTTVDKVRVDSDIHELLEEPVEEKGGERIVWEHHQVTLARVPGYGFGIAVSGGRDNPHFTNGDPSIAISDVLKAGPAEGKLLINDRVVSADSVSLEGVDYATAVQVLRDSGQTVNLVVKRRVVLPPQQQPQPQPTADVVRVGLSRGKKKDEFGVVLGCKIYVKDITANSLAADKEEVLQKGDLVLKINGVELEGLSLKEAKKLLETTKDRLDLVIRKPRRQSDDADDAHDPTQLGTVQKGNLGRVGGGNQVRRKSSVRAAPPSVDPPPRPPVPWPQSKSAEVSAYDGLSKGQLLMSLNGGDGSSSSKNVPDPRFISFLKAGSVGIRLTGGNDVGIFVTAVQPGSPAAQQGLQPGDKILKVNDMDMKGVTREEAVLFLLSLQDQINLIAQFRKEEYDRIVSLQRGDSFYIKAHFNNDNPDKGEMAFRKSDVFHVVDTLHNGVVGAWQAFRMDPFLSGLGRAAEQVQKGVIPNKARAEELATRQFNAAKKEQNLMENSNNNGGKSSSFFRRKKASHYRRSKSLGKDHWEELIWSESMSKFPAYERVSLRHPGFPRPVVMFGPVADIARERLLRDYPGKFASPQQDSPNNSSEQKSKSGIVRLSSIRDIMDSGKHALLDVTPSAVDKLNYAQFYPIVIFARADSKQTIKDCRAGLPKKAHMSSKKLLEQCQKLEKFWAHVYTGTMNLTSINVDGQWYNKLTDLIDKQQTAPIWMSESRPEESFSDDFLFPMTSRLTCTSSPESDGEFCDSSEPNIKTLGRLKMDNSKLQLPSHAQSTLSLAEQQRMTRSNSDPSMARQEGTTSDNPMVGSITTQNDQIGDPALAAAVDGKRRSQGGDSKYGFSGKNDQPENKVDESVDELPLPPHPQQEQLTHNQATAKSSATTTNNRCPGRLSPGQDHRAGDATAGGNSKLWHAPPKIDRQKKPIRRLSDKLFGNGAVSGNYMNSMTSVVANQHRARLPHSSSSSLDRNGHIRDMKLSVYDSFDPSSLSSATKSSDTISTLHTPAALTNGNHERDNRSLPQETNVAASTAASSQAAPKLAAGYASSNMMAGGGGGTPKYYAGHYKPAPPPKVSVYKPVPPPKPKAYPKRSQRSMAVPGDSPGTQGTEGNYMNSGAQASNGYSNGYAVSSSSSLLHYGHYGGNGGTYAGNRGNYNATTTREENDSGQGSSLDRDYSHNGNNQYSYTSPYGRSNSSNHGQYYYNVPPQQQHQPPATRTNGSSPQRRPDGLDLSNREYRGSAFELYKKPSPFTNGYQ